MPHEGARAGGVTNVVTNAVTNLVATRIEAGLVAPLSRSPFESGQSPFRAGLGVWCARAQPSTRCSPVDGLEPDS